MTRAAAIAAATGALGAAFVAAPATSTAQADSSRYPALIRAASLRPVIGLGVAAALVSPGDRWITHVVRTPELVRSATVRDAMRAVSAAGGPGALAAGAGLFLWGAVSGRQDVEDTGRRATEAILAATALTDALKAVCGRARPYVSGDANAGDLQFGRGWRGGDDYRSLPSGHATAAFALATTLTQARARRGTASRTFSALVYGGAALVALSRVYLDEHWASDVLLGASIGTAAGIAVFRLR